MYLNYLDFKIMFPVLATTAIRKYNQFLCVDTESGILPNLIGNSDSLNIDSFGISCCL